ncbi:MAG: putative Type pilus pilin [Parcubacteria group bacterium]|nr:putative Type pilus pilin [Parcubacteria group bacterium]
MTYRASPKGFTLVEMIVSIGLFSIVMLVAMSAYFTLISLDRRARATNQVVSNLSFAVDSMVRGIRTGSLYHCIDGGADADGNSTSGACTEFYYTDSNLPAGNNVVTYFLHGTSILRNQGNANSVLTDTASALTDPSIAITKFKVYVRGAGTGNVEQPQVLFTISGTMPADSSGNPTTFVIEENATQRLIDL